MKKFSKVTLAAVMALSSLAVGATVLADEANPTQTTNKGVITLEEAKDEDGRLPDIQDPEDPDEPNVFPEPKPDPVYGPLTVDYISQFNFGTVKINGNNTTYDALPAEVKLADEEGAETREVPNYLQISDNRAKRTGWTLQVKMSKQFTAADNATLDKSVISISDFIHTKKSENSSAALEFSKKPVAISDTFQSVASAAVGQGYGTHSVLFGEIVEKPVSNLPNAKTYNANPGVKVMIPGDALKDVKAYEAELTWNLSTTPENFN